MVRVRCPAPSQISENLRLGKAEKFVGLEFCLLFGEQISWIVFKKKETNASSQFARQNRFRLISWENRIYSKRRSILIHS